MQISFQNGFSDKNSCNTIGDTPLHLAAQNGFLDICKILIKSGANRCPKNNKFETPYCMAVQQQHSEVASYIRNFGKGT